MTEFVSGEIYFRAKLSAGSQLDFHKKLKSLDDFLQSDSNSEPKGSQSRAVLERLKKTRKLNSTVYDLVVAHEAVTLQQYFAAACDTAKNEAASSAAKITDETIQLQESTDTKIMQHLLQYFSILKEEVNSTRERLVRHSVECNRKKHQAKRLRDIQIFANHLQIETHGGVTIESISLGNPQWLRCGKAVKDNLSDSRLRRSYDLPVYIDDCGQ